MDEFLFCKGSYSLILKSKCTYGKKLNFNEVNLKSLENK